MQIFFFFYDLRWNYPMLKCSTKLSLNYVTLLTTLNLLMELYEVLHSSVIIGSSSFKEFLWVKCDINMKKNKKSKNELKAEKLTASWWDIDSWSNFSEPDLEQPHH